MTEQLDAIWKGDELGRREEAALLERFLRAEAEFLVTQARQESYVLALDAAYGQGKTWFLDRLRKQLALTHPVAFIDAWADDASEEPLLAFMAAIEDALKPFMKSERVREWLIKAKFAALPALGKLSLGGGRRLLQKVAGNAIDEELAELWEDTTGIDIEAKDAAKVVETALEKTEETLTSLVDRRGAEMLATYRKARSSRVTFRARMGKLAEAIEGDSAGRTGPLFVVIDELDRCRPNYAIRMLEEIKHFFDVPGVVFIIAVHGDQLKKSIAPVYGAEFDAEHYLRRFFSRTYRLRRLSVSELARTKFLAAGISGKEFSYPMIIRDGGLQEEPPEVFAGLFLDQCGPTPREVGLCIDAVRIFAMQWDEPVPIELPLLLADVLAMLRSTSATSLSIADGDILHAPGNRYFGENRRISAKALIHAYRRMNGWTYSMPSNQGRWEEAQAYVATRVDAEFQTFHASRSRQDSSLINTYHDRLARIAWLLPTKPEESIFT